MMSISSWMYTHSFTRTPERSVSAGERAGAVLAAEPVQLIDERRRERDAVLEPFGAPAVLHLARHQHPLHAFGRLRRVDVADQTIDVGAEVGDGHEVVDVESDEQIPARDAV